MNDYKKILYLFFRYALIVLVAYGELDLFYAIFTPLTVGLVFTTLSLFTEAALLGTNIFLEHVTIELIPACIMGSAFYLLFILLFSTPNIPTKKRLTILVTTSLTLLLFNVIRILFLISLHSFSGFELIHWTFFHIISFLFVTGIWIGAKKAFSITAVPVLDDLHYLWRLYSNDAKIRKKH